MAYIRKTRDVYEVQGMYNDGFGWSVETTEDTYQEAREQIKCYRENCPQYEFRIVKKRERLEGEEVYNPENEVFSAQAEAELKYL
jgi:hypothetical protein